MTSSVCPDSEGTSAVAVLPFCVERCVAGPRAAAPEAVEASWPTEVIHTAVPDPVLPGQPEPTGDGNASFTPTRACSSPVGPSQQTVEEKAIPSQLVAEEEATCLPTTLSGVAAESTTVPNCEQSQASHAPLSLQRSRHNPPAMTLEQAVQDYLEDRRSHHRRPKTLEWHRIALGLFQHYLLTSHECVLLGQMTEAQVRDWLVWFSKTTTVTGHPRSSSTVESYARSARAFCQWLVRHRYLPATPFAHLPLPQVENRVVSPLEPEEWERLLLACRPSKETGVLAERATARNRAILWVLFETGMRASDYVG